MRNIPERAVKPKLQKKKTKKKNKKKKKKNSFIRFMHIFINLYFLECSNYDTILISFNCFFYPKYFDIWDDFQQLLKHNCLVQINLLTHFIVIIWNYSLPITLAWKYFFIKVHGNLNYSKIPLLRPLVIKTIRVLRAAYTSHKWFLS